MTKKLSVVEILAKRQAKRDSIPQKVAMFKGWVIAHIVTENKFQVFSREEWSYGEGCRYPEFDDCGSIEEAKNNVG